MSFKEHRAGGADASPSRAAVVLRILGVGVVLGCVLGPAWAYRSLYYADKWSVEGQIRSIPGVENVEVRGSDDIGFDVHAASFTISSRPGSIVVLAEPDPGPLDSPGRLLVRQLGPWEFSRVEYEVLDTARPGDGGATRLIALGSSLDFLELGRYGANPGVRVGNLRDLVDNYDSLVEYFSAWHGDDDWAVVRESPTVRVAHCRTAADLRRSVLPPPGLPRTWR